jgi:hypothetical protein
VLIIKQYKRNSKQSNFILNQIIVIIYSYQHSIKNIYLGFFKFYQPKATGGGFLIFEWTLHISKIISIKNTLFKCKIKFILSKNMFILVRKIQINILYF